MSSPLVRRAILAAESLMQALEAIWFSLFKLCGSVRQRLRLPERLSDALLRSPFLFVLDAAYFTSSLFNQGVGWLVLVATLNLPALLCGSGTIDWERHDSLRSGAVSGSGTSSSGSYSGALLSYMSVVILLFGCVLLFMLPRRYLVRAYAYLLEALLLLLSYRYNVDLVHAPVPPQQSSSSSSSSSSNNSHSPHTLTPTPTPLSTPMPIERIHAHAIGGGSVSSSSGATSESPDLSLIWIHAAIQLVLGCTFNWILFRELREQLVLRNRGGPALCLLLSSLSVVSFLLTPCTLVASRLTGLSMLQALLSKVPLIGVLLPLALIDLFIYLVADQALELARRAFYYMDGLWHNHGVFHLVGDLWTRLRVPNALRVFWLLRCAAHLLFLVVMAVHDTKRRSIIEAFAHGEFDVNATDARASVLNELVVDAVANGNANESDANVTHSYSYLYSSAQWSSDALSKEAVASGSLASAGIGSASHMAAVTAIVGTAASASCENWLALLGMSSVMGELGAYFGQGFVWVLVSDSEQRALVVPEEEQFASVTGLLFLLLSLQTGLVQFGSEKRLSRLSKNIALLFTAQLHMVQRMCHALLLNLGVRLHVGVAKHVRVLLVSAALLVYPVVFLCVLYPHVQLSTWVFSLSVFSIELGIKSALSLLQYLLFVVDSRFESTTSVDDCLYYLRAANGIVEFIAGCLLLGNGLIILFLESGGVIRALMMALHAYVNIFLQVRVRDELELEHEHEFDQYFTLIDTHTVDVMYDTVQYISTPSTHSYCSAVYTSLILVISYFRSRGFFSHTISSQHRVWLAHSITQIDISSNFRNESEDTTFVSFLIIKLVL